MGGAVLEQVFLNMPEVIFYFYSDKKQTTDSIEAYLGSTRLHTVYLRRFSEGDRGTLYYLLLDVSASISEERFQSVKSALSEWAESLGENDKVVLITFGENVNIIFGGCSESALMKSQFDKLENKDQYTMLFEAINQMTLIADKAVLENGTMRRVAMVVTDGEDLATGTTTRDESQRSLVERGIPVYGFAVPEAKRESINLFGEFVRTSGGYLTILEDGKESAGFLEFTTYLNNCYEAGFCSDTNMVTNGMVNLTLKLKDANYSLTRQALQNRWIKDNERPVVLKARQLGDKEIELLFSESVLGADVSGHYDLESGDVPVAVTYDDEKAISVLKFSSLLPEGTLKINYHGITDNSMEKNLLDGETEIVIYQEEINRRDQNIYPWIGIFILVVTCLFFWRWRKRHKRGKKSEDLADSDAVRLSKTERPVHVIVQEKKLEKKYIEMQIEGKEQPITVEINGSLIIGRSRTCDIYFDDAVMSRHHFALEMVDGMLYLRNLSKTAGTLVNGVMIGEKPYLLSSDDQITAGRISMKLRW